MNKKSIITGITGQDGSYLAEFLLDKGYEVHGIIRRGSVFTTERIEHLMNDDEIYEKKLFLHYGDMTDSSNLTSLVSKIKPCEIYNLAAQSHIKVSFEVPEYTADVDALGCLRLLDAMHQNCPDSKFYQASTSEIYGGQINEMPKNGFDENTKFHPRSPYGAAKLYAYWITKNYREAYGSFACNGILFNHESPRRGETFVTKKITKWCGENLLSLKERNFHNIKPLRLGNMNAYRDWGHAKDYVKSQWLILQQDEPNDYVVATGETHTVREFVKKCFDWMEMPLEWSGSDIDEVGICAGNIVVKVDKKYFRPSEVDVLLGNPSKIKKIGWKPEFNFDMIVDDMMKYDCYQPLRATKQD